MLEGEVVKLDNRYFFYKSDNIATPFLSANNMFSKEECENIIKLGGNDFQESYMEAEKWKNEYRKSSNFSIEHNNNTKWIFERMASIILDANNEWNFEISGFAEKLQLTKYTKGGKYGMHMDSGVQGTPMARKLSIVVQLTDPLEYQGGDLEILCNTGNISATKEQG
jgi:PKHD-type hydroxylase